MGDELGEVGPNLPAVELGAAARDIAVGQDLACAALVDGGVRCWGTDSRGTLGLATGYEDESDRPVIGDDEVPTAVDPIRLPGAGVVEVSAMNNHVCAIHEGGAVSCWGETGPWLGYGAVLTDLGAGYGDDEHPDLVGHVDVGGPVSKILVGNAFTCALLESAEVKCWGRSNWGQLGFGNTNYVGFAETPAEVGPVSLGGPVADIGAGWDHVCAVLQSGDARCWGYGGYGALGQNSTEHIGDDELPSDVPPIEFR